MTHTMTLALAWRHRAFLWKFYNTVPGITYRGIPINPHVSAPMTDYKESGLKRRRTGFATASRRGARGARGSLFYKRGLTYKLARLTARCKGNFKRVMRALARWIDYDIASVNITNASNGVMLSILPALLFKGDDHDTRQADYITIRSIDIRTRWVMTPFATPTNNDHSSFIRVIMFQWKEDALSIVPTPGDILEQPTTDANMYSHYKKNPTTKYKVIFDKRFHMGQSSNTRLGNMLQYRRYRYKKKTKVLFDGANAPRRGQVYLLIFGNSASAASPNLQPFFSAKCRMNFDV